MKYDLIIKKKKRVYGKDSADEVTRFVKVGEMTGYSDGNLYGAMDKKLVVEEGESLHLFRKEEVRPKKFHFNEKMLDGMSDLH
jgi:hypothetical protein